MKKTLFICLLLLMSVFTYSGSFANIHTIEATTQSEVQVGDPREVTYYSYNFNNDDHTEYIMVVFKYDYSEIHDIYYWTDDNPTKIEMVILETDYHEGEISGWTGEVKFSEGELVFGFGIIEDRFTLSYGEYFFQEFDYLKTEY